MSVRLFVSSVMPYLYLLLPLPHVPLQLLHVCNELHCFSRARRVQGGRFQVRARLVDLRLEAAHVLAQHLSWS